MIITLKTLQEDAFTVEIDPLQTVRCFKEKIEKVKGQNFPAKHMKLMYAGKFLLDNNRVCDYNLEEKKFVIAVIKQPKRQVVRDEQPDPIDISLINGTHNSSERERMLCASHEMLVQHIAELGFTRSEVEQALNASYNNPDRAVDYLISNVCAGLSRGNSDANSPNNGPMPDIPDTHFLHQIAHTEHSSSSNSILPSQERIFELFSEAVTECENQTRAEDRMIEANHQHIIESYAELEAAGITDPHEIFSGSGLECSNSLGPYASASPRAVPIDSYSEFQSNRYECLQTVQAGPGELNAQGDILDRDQEAIERLRQLGFSDQKVLEAYFVCEKNENAAADYLFTQYE